MNDALNKLKMTALLAGDLAVLYGALLATLFLRYGAGFYGEPLALHLEPFSAVFAVWIFVFYVAGLYDLKTLKNGLGFSKIFGISVVVNGAIAIFFFYLVPSFGIAPKTNLLIFLIVFGVLGYYWRHLFNYLLSAGSPPNKIILVGSDEISKEIAAQIKQNPQLGYEIKFWMKEGLGDKEMGHLAQIILANDINVIAIPSHLKKNFSAARAIYRNLALGIEVIDLASLYETVFQKVPAGELEEVWFLDHLAKSRKVYGVVKRPIEFILAVFAAIILLPLMAAIAIAVFLFSGRPVVYKQTRVGKNEGNFTLYKFRTMKKDAEAGGAKWAEAGDRRTTGVGAFLRRAHLDEILQIFNIIKGDISFVGPRPERPEFVEKLKAEIPYFEIRHIIKPGLTGWAQINYRYGASVEDAKQKLQYDIYYLKNRSLLLDAAIVLRTIKMFFISLK
ncbi:MAG: sugar transferase [Parcubacteria group bacterium]|nr:sugar transferase [Parcubacteria group bacterium]